MGRGPHPKAEADLIGGCGCSPLDGREVVQAEARKRESSTGVPAKLTEKPAEGVPE